MHHQPPPSIVAGATPTKTLGADASPWTEHKSPAGIPYYYNSATGVSTYERPASMPQAPAAASVVSPKQAPPASESPSKSKWQTYTDEKSGKKYYSDGVTTTWTRPAELPPEAGAEDGGRQQQQQKRASSSDADGDGRKAKKKKTSSSDSKASNEVSPYASKAEAIAAFKGLLLAKDVAPTTKWSDVQRMCSDDARWEACTSVGERKQALAEYQTKRANELRDVKRQEKVRAKEAYLRLLNDVLLSSSSSGGGTGKAFAPGSSRFVDVRDSLSKDDRFYAVEDETTREELFYEWVEELRKKEERAKRNKRRDAKDNCILFLKGMEEGGKLTFASTW